MKKLMVAMMALILFPAVAGASTYTFTTNDLWSLDHGKAYTWGITKNLPLGEVITGATLSFVEIYNWRKEDNVLYIHLLDTTPDGAKASRDNGTGDFFLNQGVRIGSYTDGDGPKKIDDLISFSFNSEQLLALNNYAKDGNFGFGLDPDCHFYNTGITFEVTTAPVPEPATLLLLGSGLLGLVGIRRRGKRVNG